MSDIDGHPSANATATPDDGIFALSDAYMVQAAAIDPIMATGWGIPGHDHQWNDFSPHGWAARLELLQTTRRRAERLVGCGRKERVAIDVLRERCDAEAALIEAGELQIALGPLNGHHVLIREVFDFMPRDEAAWDAIRERLAGIPAALASVRDCYLDSAARGRVAARRQALACADQCTSWSTPDGPFAELADECTTLDLTTEAARAAAAFAEFGEWLRTEYAPIADPLDGIGHDRYELHVRFHTGSHLDLDETYAWGWDELRRITDRMDAVAGELHPGTRRAECIERIKVDDRYVVADADAFIEWSQTTIDRTLQELHGSTFDIPEPLWQCRVMRAPPGVSSDAFYSPPNEDFSRPGMTWQPVDGRTTFPLWDELSTLYHEAVPGHHLQVGHMMYLGDSLTRFQRLAVFVSAHGEGWALYAERLMHELGYLDDPVYELGWLANQALRAARVVVDIGLHCHLAIPGDESFHPGEAWTPDLATAFLTDTAGYDTARAGEQINRYLGMPAQAISYKVGERVFVAGRERTKRRLGDRFDLKRFHAGVLDLGALGLDQLDAEFDLLT